MLGDALWIVDSAQRVGSACELFQLGTEKSAAVDAGTPLSGAATAACPCIVQGAAQRGEPVGGLVEGAGRPVPLVETGLAYGRQRWHPPFPLGKKALFSS